MYYVVLNKTIVGRKGFGASAGNYFSTVKEAVSFANNMLMKHGGFVTVREGKQGNNYRQQPEIYYASKI